MPIVSVDLLYGQEIKIKKNSKVNYFMAVGKMVNNTGFDFAEVMCNLTPAAYKVFWEMVKLRDIYTNIVEIDSSNNSNSQNSIISKGYRVLQENQLVIKIGKGRYMLNPHAILPTFDRCTEVNKEWSKLSGSIKPKKRE